MEVNPIPIICPIRPWIGTSWELCFEASHYFDISATHVINTKAKVNILCYDDHCLALIIIIIIIIIIFIIIMVHLQLSRLIIMASLSISWGFLFFIINMHAASHNYVIIQLCLSDQIMHHGDSHTSIVMIMLSMMKYERDTWKRVHYDYTKVEFGLSAKNILDIKTKTTKLNHSYVTKTLNSQCIQLLSINSQNINFYLKFNSLLCKPGTICHKFII